MIPVLGNVMSVIDLVGDLASGESAFAIGMDMLGIFGGGEIKGAGKALALLSHLKLSKLSRISDELLSRFGRQYERRLALSSETCVSRQGKQLVSARDEYRISNLSSQNEFKHGVMYSDNGNDIAFNLQHGKAFPASPRPSGSHGGSLQSHHLLQQAFMKKMSSEYNGKLAPTVTIETNVRPHTVDYDLPHSVINKLQSQTRKQTNLNHSLDEEINYGIGYMQKAGFSNKAIQQALNDNYAMLDKLNLKYTKVMLR